MNLKLYLEEEHAEQFEPSVGYGNITWIIKHSINEYTNTKTRVQILYTRGYNQRFNYYFLIIYKTTLYYY